MNRETVNDMPICTCPHCEHRWQWDDWYHLDAGDTFSCPKCEKEIEVWDKEVSCTLTFAKPNKEVEG